MTNTIALLTDFGTQDIYVGVMKGVMHGIAPDAHFIDITHNIEPQNVQEAAFALVNAYHYFPKGTVFLVVVDPGVGSSRMAIAVQAGDYHFIAPDNGVLSYVLDQLGKQGQAVALTNTQYHLNAISRTFHGRDIFAPSAAHIAAGVPVATMGDAMEHIIRLETPIFEVSGNTIRGEVIHIDHFGNSVSSIGQFHWLDDERLLLKPAWGGDDIEVVAATAAIQSVGHILTPICRTYSDVMVGEALVLIGSEGYLEVAANQGNAARRYQLELGDEIVLSLNN